MYKYNSQTNPELWVVFAQTSGLHCVDAEEGTLEVSAAGRHGHATAANGKRLIDRPRVCYEFVFASRPSLTLGCFCLNCLNLNWKSSSGYLVLMTICCLSSFFDSDVCRFVSSFVILHCHWKWPHVADAQALCAKEPTLKLRCFVVVLNHSARRQRSHKPQLCFKAVNAQQVKWHDQNLLKSCDTCHCTGYFLANYGLKHRCPQLWMGIYRSICIIFHVILTCLHILQHLRAVATHKDMIRPNTLKIQRIHGQLRSSVSKRRALQE